MAYTKTQAKSIAARGQGGGKRGAVARAKATGNASLVKAVKSASNRGAFIRATKAATTTVVSKPPRKASGGPQGGPKLVPPPQRKMPPKRTY